MRRKPKGPSDAPLAPVPSEILDEFVRQGPLTPEELDAAVRRFKKAVIERALGGELTHHVGSPPGGVKPDDTTNHRNGTGPKTVLTDDGPLPIDVPRDREGTFEPSKKTTGYIGSSGRVCQAVTSSSTASVTAALHRFRRQDPGALCASSRILTRSAVFPETTLQTCIVHLMRQSLNFANWKERKPMASALRTIYGAPTAEGAGAALDAFERGPWGQKVPTVVASWRRAWTHVIPFFAFPPEVRRVIYTTNALERVHAQLRKIIKTRGHFPNDEAATKLIWLALRNITAKWQRGHIHWRAAMNQFAMFYESRFTSPIV